MSTADWHHMFEELAQPFHPLTRNEHYYYSVIRAIWEQQPVMDRGETQLFKLNALHHSLRKLVENTATTLAHPSRHTTWFVGVQTEIALKKALDDVHELLDAPPAFELNSPVDLSLAEQTLASLRDAMLYENSRLGGYYWYPYLLFWAKWLVPQDGHQALIEAELEALQEAEQTSPSTYNAYRLQLARGWLYFFGGDDEAAFSSLTVASQRSGLYASHVLPLVELLCQAKEWERVAEWLSVCTPLFEGIHYKNYEQLWAYWHLVAEHRPEAELKLWQALQSMLPGALTLYLTQLHTWGRWREWIDVQLSLAESDPLEYRVDTFKPIERDAPELLLPYYHQAAERYLLMKNRDSYKKSVKLLKRLSKLYKKMKKTDEWERFMEALVQRNSRLRAFIEELRKGKLIE